jgi:hypothetical protein
MTLEVAPVNRLAIAATAAAGLLSACCKSSGSLSADDSQPQLSPATLDFGTVLTGSTSEKPLDLHNAGGFTLQATGVTLTPAESGDPSFSADPISGQEVEPGSDFTWQVHFDPTQDGVHQATLLLRTNSNGTPTVQVQLTGVSYSYEVSIAPTALDFGEVQVGTRSTPQSFVVTNDSTIAETLSLGTLSPDGGFSMTPSESTVQLAAGEAATFQAVFAPSAPGAAQATLPILPCPTCAATSIALSGVGVDTILVATPASVAFGNVPVGVSISEPVTIQAVALPPGSRTALAAELAAPLLGSGGGPDGGDGFALAESGTPNPWPAQLAPPASVQFTVTFTASTPPAVSDSAVVPYSVGTLAKSPLIVLLSAGSQQAPCSQVTATPGAVDFGSVAAGQSASQVITLTNGGSQTCQLTNVGIGLNDATNDFGMPAGTQTSLTMTPGMSAAFTIDFAPSDSAPPLTRRGTFVATANQQQPPQVDVPLTGSVGGATGADAGLPTTCYTSQYSYTCVWNGTQVAITHLCNSTLEGLPDNTLVGTCNGFDTNDPTFSCLNGEDINTFVAPQELPGVYLVHNGLMGGQCTYGLWSFQLQ